MILLLLFPTGRPLSPRWWWVVWLAAVANVLVIVGALPLWPLRGVALLGLREVPSPVGPLGVVYIVGEWGVIAAGVAAAASLLVRFRRARGAERQQIKWLLYTAVVFGVGVPPASLLAFTIGASELAADVVGAMFVAGLPAAIGVAILKYRLYDLDRLINRTLVYGLLTTLLGLGYAGLVLVLGQVFGGIGAEPPSWAVAGATLAVAALFQPARRRVQAAVDRRFNRRRYHAAQTIEAFSARLRDEIDLDTLRAELLAVVDHTMEPTTVSLWLRPRVERSVPQVHH